MVLRLLLEHYKKERRNKYAVIHDLYKFAPKLQSQIKKSINFENFMIIMTKLDPEI